MKIVYSDINIDKEIKKFSAITGAGIEFRKNLEDTFNDFKKANKDSAIGMPIPESFIDLGKFLFCFFLGSVASGIAYDLIKSSIKNLLIFSRNSTFKKFDHFLISDGDDPNKFDENIYFYLPTELSDSEVDLCLDEIRKIVDAINDLKNLADLAGSPRFYYVENDMRKYHKNKVFVLQEIVISS